MKLTIVRDTGYYGALCKIKILLDGQTLCSISNNETITVDVPNGIHSISAKSGWVETNHLNLDFGAGDKKIRLIANYAPKEELKKGLKKISWWNPFHNIKETISTIKKSAQGRNEDGEPILALKDETPQEC
jgi:hypothetical protein